MSTSIALHRTSFLPFTRRKAGLVAMLLHVLSVRCQLLCCVRQKRSCYAFISPSVLVIAGLYYHVPAAENDQDYIIIIIMI